MKIRAVAATGAATGAVLATWALWEPYRYRLVTREVRFAPTSPSLDVLHLSDTHLRSADDQLVRFLTQLADRLGEVDLVIATGDMIEDDSGIGPALEALGRFAARLGRFYVLGSHDYYQASYQAYTKYFGKRDVPKKARGADTRRFEDGLAGQGWVALTNATRVLDTEHGKIRLAGVDDPYLNRHDTEHIERASREALAIGLVHSPDVVSEWALNGFDLVLAGHTHGGQVRLPVLGALVTNSSLPAQLAKGLHRVGPSWLHVSPGLGTGKFTPVRFLCPPEATLLRLRPAVV